MAKKLFYMGSIGVLPLLYMFGSIKMAASENFVLIDVANNIVNQTRIVLSSWIEKEEIIHYISGLAPIDFRMAKKLFYMGSIGILRLLYMFGSLEIAPSGNFVLIGVANSIVIRMQYFISANDCYGNI